MRWYGCYCCQGVLLREADLGIALGGNPVKETDNIKSNENIAFYYL